MSIPNEQGALHHDPQATDHTAPPTAEDLPPTEEPTPPAPDWHTQYLHLYADFENYRKRMQRLQVGWRVAAQEEALIPLLPLLDDLERALATPTGEQDHDSLRTGVLLIQQKLQELLRQQGVTPMGVQAGDAFDTDRHEAIARRKGEQDQDSDTILEVVRQGYLCQGKVMRTAQVRVATS